MDGGLWDNLSLFYCYNCDCNGGCDECDFGGCSIIIWWLVNY